MMKNAKAGFTLAEVLTTLMVIGVVAAMTIPTLMNSTQNQQAQVAAKKASSVLSQGVQLLIAREVECAPNTTDASAGLTSCMANVLSGTVDTTNHTITTADGMVYKFFANESLAGKFKDVATTCSEQFLGHAGGGNCGVVVDTNGLSKGTSTLTTITFDADGFGTFPAGEEGTDVVAFSLSASGVTPAGLASGNNYSTQYLLGKNATVNSTDNFCCKTASKCASGTTNQGKYPTTACQRATSGSSCNSGTEEKISTTTSIVNSCN